MISFVGYIGVQKYQNYFSRDLARSILETLVEDGVGWYQFWEGFVTLFSIYKAMWIIQWNKDLHDYLNFV